MPKTQWKPKAATTAMVVAACAVCCAPLIAPPVLALFATAGIGAALFGRLEFVVAVAVLAGGLLLYRHSQRRKATTRACGCQPNEGCTVGNECRLPEPGQ